MSKKHKNNSNKEFSILGRTQDGHSEGNTNNIQAGDSARKKGIWKRFGRFEKVGIFGLIFLLSIGVMGSGLGNTIINSLLGDSNSSNSVSRNTGSSSNSETSLLSKLNPFAQPMPSNTPQLAKEYIYAGSRLLAVEDAGATSAPLADLAIWRPSNGQWWVKDPTGGSQHTVQQWGASKDIPVQGDYDGDGKVDFAVYRAVSGGTSVWYIVNSSDGSTSANSYGLSDDIPVPADYDGDGKVDVAVYRPGTSNGVWYIQRSSDGGTTTHYYGVSTDIPAVGDYDGDGKADVTLWRSSDTNFYTIKSTTNASATINFSQASTEPVSADYDGDGMTDYAVRNSTQWTILDSSTGTYEPTISWQQAGDVSVPADYDGDGRADVAVWRDSNGTWYIRKSSAPTTTTIIQWGASGDIPVPAKYRR